MFKTFANVTLKWTTVTMSMQMSLEIAIIAKDLSHIPHLYGRAISVRKQMFIQMHLMIKRFVVRIPLEWATVFVRK